jgi:hypothetical protein
VPFESALLRFANKQLAPLVAPLAMAENLPPPGGGAAPYLAYNGLFAAAMPFAAEARKQLELIPLAERCGAPWSAAGLYTDFPDSLKKSHGVTLRPRVRLRRRGRQGRSWGFEADA